MKSVLMCLVALSLMVFAVFSQSSADETGSTNSQQSSKIADGRITSVFPDMIDAYKINLSSKDGVVFGDTFEVLQNGKPVAKAIVVKELAGCSVICIKGESGRKCSIGDTVRFLQHRKQIVSTRSQPPAATTQSSAPNSSNSSSSSKSKNPKQQPNVKAAGVQGVSITTKECINIVDEKYVTRAYRVYAMVTNNSDAAKSNITACCSFKYPNGSIYRVDEVKVDSLSPGESKEVIFYCEKDFQPGNVSNSLDALMPRDNNQVNTKNTGANSFDRISPSVNIIFK
ncbi:MAG: hypothetical protein AB9903_25060 [Vulcanimicrobiota bacterium]